jgi:predicted esterase
MVLRLLVVLKHSLCLLSVIPSFCMAFSDPAALGRLHMHSVRLASTVTRSTSTGRAMTSSADSVDVRTHVRILALHGKGGTGASFERSLEPLVAALNDTCTAICFDWDFPTAPYSLGPDESAGRAWWELPAGERSFTASKYIGYDKSAERIEDKLRLGDGYDVVIGHSQGAILLAALFATNRMESVIRHPTAFIFNGAAIPNPFKGSLVGIQLSPEIAKQSDALFVVGHDDRINPPDGAIIVRDCLQRGGMKVETISHPGGHSFPVRDDEALNSVVDWIIDTVVKYKVMENTASGSRL